MATNRWISTSSTDWATGANWSTGSAPSTGDDAYFDANGTADVLLNLNQSGVTLASLNIASTYTGNIGSASAYLQISATALNIGAASNDGTTGSGSGRIKINVGTNQTAAVIYSTASTSTDTGVEPVRLLGSHASNAITVLSGRVGIATTVAGETSVFATANVVGDDSYLDLGPGVTLTTVSNNGGNITANSAMTTLNSIGGTTTVWGAGLIGTCNADGGQLNLFNKASGTDITTLNWNGSTLNFRGQPTSLTIGTTAIKRGGTASLFSASQVNWGTVTFDPTYITNVSITTDPV